MVMTSRERVIKALNHQEADRIPIDFGGTVVTSLDYHAHRNLKRHINLPEGEDQIIDYSMGTVEPCDELKLMFASDFRRVAMNVKTPKIIDGVYQDGFGMLLRKALPHEYYDVARHPLADAEITDLAVNKMSDSNDPELCVGLENYAQVICYTDGLGLQSRR